MADRSITIRIGANVQGFTSALATARKSAEDWGKGTLDWAQRNNAAIGTLSNGVGMMGLALTGFAALAVKKFADFDAAMSNVQAATMESATNMDLLRDAALEAGARTVYSATEAADAIENLAKAGVSTADILAGGLDGALDLAAAGAMDVGEAAEIAASAMTQFELAGSDVAHVADLLAAGAGKAQGEVTDLGQALSQSGLVANQMGLSIEETVGSLTAFAKAGLTGSDAGTSFRAMLLRLANPTKESADLMADLGINAYDAGGEFVGMSGLAGQLQDRLKGLTQEQRNAALAQIFGMDAIRSASILYEQGADGIDRWTSAVDDQGYAAEVAAARLDNLKGDLEQLSGSFETALIGMGEGADGPLRAMVQGLTDVVNAFAELPDGAQQATLGIVGATGLVGLGTAGLGKLVVGISEVKGALGNLGISAKTAGIAMGGIGGVITLAAVALGSWASTQSSAKAHMDALTQSIDKQSGAWTELTREELYNRAKADPSWWSEFSDGARSAADNAEKVGVSMQTVVDAAMGVSSAQKEIDDLDRSINRSSSSSMDQINAINQLTDWIGKEQGVLKDAQAAQDEYNEVVGQGTEAQEVAAESARDMADATQYVGMSTEDATAALKDWRDAVSTADQAFIDLQGAYQSVIDKNTEIAQSTADTTKDAEDSWETYYDGVSVSATDYIAQLQAQVDAQAAWEQNMLDITARVAETMPANMQDAADAMVDELLDLGPEGAAQVQLLHDMTDEELAKVVELWSQKGTDAVAEFTNQVEGYRNPVIELQVDTDPAYAMVDSFVRTQNGRTIYLNLAGQEVGFSNGRGVQSGFAGGGWTGDVPTTAVAGVVHGREFVVKAGPASVHRAELEAMNAGTRGYARGGYVEPLGSSTSSVSLPSDGWAISGSLRMSTDGFVELVDARLSRAQRGRTAAQAQEVRR